MTALLLAQGGILDDLGINPWVVGMQAIVFFLTFLALRRLLFGRILDHMTAREAEAERATDAIRRERAESERLSREYEAELARIDKEAWERLQGLLKEALAARARVVADSQQKASEEIRAALEVIAKEKAAALAALRADVPALARQAAGRVLGVPMEPDALEAPAKGGHR